MFDALFQPIKIGQMEVKNRFVMPPMGTNLANHDGTAGTRSLSTMPGGRGEALA